MLVYTPEALREYPRNLQPNLIFEHGVVNNQ